MDVHKRSQSNVGYSRKLLSSGLEGARSGRDSFLNGKPLAPLLREFAENALGPAALGVCIGILGSHPGNGYRSGRRAFAYGVLGGVIGFGAGMAWGSRHLAASVTAGALRNVGRTRDEHWLERNPIDYA